MGRANTLRRDTIAKDSALKRSRAQAVFATTMIARVVTCWICNRLAAQIPPHATTTPCGIALCNCANTPRWVLATAMATSWMLWGCVAAIVPGLQPVAFATPKSSVVEPRSADGAPTGTRTAWYFWFRPGRLRRLQRLEPVLLQFGQLVKRGAEDLLSFLGVYGQAADCAGYADASWVRRPCQLPRLRLRHRPNRRPVLVRRKPQARTTITATRFLRALAAVSG